MTKRRTRRAVLGAVVLFSAPGVASPLDDAVVFDEADAAHAQCLTGAATDGLAALEGLAARLGEGERRHRPLLWVLVGHCLQLAGRPEAALAAYDRALAALGPGPEADEARDEAERLRAALLVAAFGDLRAACEPGVQRVRLVERGDAVTCPARWPTLVAGAYHVQSVSDDGTFGPTHTVSVSAGGATDVLVEAPAPQAALPDGPGGWRLGGRVGLGIASIIGDTPYQTAGSAGLSWRLVGEIESPRLGGWLSGQVEFGVRRSTMHFSDTGFGIDGDVGALDVDLSWWLLHSALLARGCERSSGWALCGVTGAEAGLVMHAEEHREGEVITAPIAWDAVHLGVRAGIELQTAWRAAFPVFGIHAAWSPWPGVIELAGARQPQLRVWVDAGIAF